MAREFALAVVAPDRAVVETTATAVIVPGTEGYFGVMAGHMPLIAALRPGVLEYVDATGRRHYVAMGGGFAEVSGDRVTVLADEAIPAPEIELSKAEAELEEARRALRGESSGMTADDAVQGVERAMVRVRAARNTR
jgi:F-type H+-transporting ATPase subunit epsilon